MGLGKNKTPAMAIGLYHRPIAIAGVAIIARLYFPHVLTDQCQKN
ncbi:hypothetical protein APA_357 [Pseudanabaena sp. lw0831]|nr:hypothetical protein APA_357 [Pseudanabaena sp. lw0831]